MKKLRVKAIAFGTLLLVLVAPHFIYYQAGLWGGLISGLSGLPEPTNLNTDPIVLFALLIVCLYFSTLSGFIAGQMAKVNRAMHGVIIGGIWLIILSFYPTPTIWLGVALRWLPIPAAIFGALFPIIGTRPIKDEIARSKNTFKMALGVILGIVALEAPFALPANLARASVAATQNLSPFEAGRRVGAVMGDIFAIVFYGIIAFLLIRSALRQQPEPIEDETPQEYFQTHRKAFGNRSVIMVLLLNVFTLGLYNSLWFISRRDKLNSLSSQTKLSGNAVDFLLLFQMIRLPTLYPNAFINKSSVITILSGLQPILTITFIVWVLILAFRVKNILDEHYRIGLSGLATFFLIKYYLQYKMNRLPIPESEVLLVTKDETNQPTV